jgi:hypothetical protein
VSENRVLRRLFGLKRDELTGGWIKLHNDELRDLNSSPGAIRNIKSRIRWAQRVAPMGEKGNVCKLLVGRTEGKRPLARPRCRWVDNIRMDFVEIGWSGVNWVDLSQDRDKWRALVNEVINLRVP